MFVAWFIDNILMSGITDWHIFFILMCSGVISESVVRDIVDRKTRRGAAMTRPQTTRRAYRSWCCILSVCSSWSRASAVSSIMEQASCSCGARQSASECRASASSGSTALRSTPAESSCGTFSVSSTTSRRSGWYRCFRKNRSAWGTWSRERSSFSTNRNRSATSDCHYRRFRRGESLVFDASAAKQVPPPGFRGRREDFGTMGTTDRKPAADVSRPARTSPRGAAPDRAAPR